MGCGEYQTPGSVPYGYQSCPDPAVSLPSYTSGINQPASSAVPFLYPLPCYKFSYCTTISNTPTVITHTDSTAGGHDSVDHAPGYPHTGDRYPEMPCHSLNYPSDPVHTALPPITVAHYFSVPEQMVGVKGKHKQKRGGLRISGLSGAQSAPLSIHAPTPTSCLAKLLSSSSCEREYFGFFFSFLKNHQ